jgi:hypothetical protein
MRVVNTIIYLFFSLIFLTACVPVKKAPTTYDMSKLSLSNSEIRVSTSQVAAGNSVVVSLRLKNKDGGGYSSTKPIVSFYVVDGTSTGVMGDATTNGGGIYTASFTGVSPGTAKRIHARIDGKEVTSFNPTIQVTIGGFSLSNSTISLSSSSVTSGDSITATLTVRDASNFQLTDGGLAVDFYHSGGISSGTFGGVNDNLDGTYSVTFTGLLAGSATNIYANIGGATVSSVSPTVAVNHGVISSLVFIQQPGNTTTDASISPSIIIVAQDSNGNTVTDYSSHIVLSLDGASNPLGATLAGTLTQTPVDGIASFSDVSINYYGVAYKLLATSGSYTILSNAFNIVPISLSYDWPFTALTTAQYTSSDWTKMEFVGGSVRLTPSIQTDTASAIGTMDAGSASGVIMGTLTDPAYSGLKLGNGGGCNGSSSDCAKQDAAEIYELSSSWAPQWNNIVGYWKLNNNLLGTVGDQMYGAAAGYNPSGKILQAVDFSNVDGQYNYSIDTDVRNLTDNFTVGLWVKPSSSANGYSNIFLFADGGTLIAPRRNGGSSEINIRIDTSAGSNQNWTVSGVSVFDDQWHYINLSISGNIASFYVDGSLKSTVPFALGTGFANNVFYTGRRLDPGQYFIGSIDEVAIWNVVLSASEIQAIYERQKFQYSGTYNSRVMDASISSSWTTLSWIPTLPFLKELPDYSSGAIQNETASDYSSLVGSSGSTGANDLMTGIVGLWHLNEAAGTSGAGSVKDDSGSVNNGTPTSITFGTTGKLLTATNFNGTSSKITIGQTNLPTGSSPFSYSAWIKTSQSTVSGYPSIFSYGTASMTNGIFFTLCYNSDTNCNPGGTLSGRLMVGPYGAALGSSVAVNDGLWHHVVATFDGTTYKLFVDGSASGSKNMTTNIIHSITPTIGYAGSLSGSAQYFNGSIDEFSIWSRALHINEIKQLYQRGASRIKYQVRSCATDPCTIESWKGPDGTSGTYFSELNNNSIPSSGAGDVKAGLPVMDWTTVSAKFPSVNTLTGQYFQYRTIFESDSPVAALGPELKSTTIDPIHYDASSPSIYGNNGVSFTDFNTFFPTLGSGGCSDELTYNLSLDKINWKYWNGVMWDDALSQAQSNSAAIIQSNSANFIIDVGRGTLYVKTYLNSTGETSCSLDNINIRGNK